MIHFLIYFKIKLQFLYLFQMKTDSLTQDIIWHRQWYWR